MLKDYHTHTFRCQHAVGDVSAYATVAVQRGLKVLGVTDHNPFPDNRWNKIRMQFEELDDYEQAIALARQTYPQLTILKGMECDYDKDLLPFYRDELLGKRDYNYLIAGVHFFPLHGKWIGAHSYIKTPEELVAYTDYLIEAMDSGVFTFIAHPDLFGSAYPSWDEHTIACSRRIIEAAVQLQIPLEINACGFRKKPKEFPQGTRPPYPLLPFWELAADYKGLTVVVNSDAHQPEDVGATAQAMALVEKYGLNLADLSYLEDTSLSSLA
ncbi:MAG: histidinol-phosphatase [Firmicutes bacterium]|nr:histidinol-phosphatase [Bacillota bacterium]